MFWFELLLLVGLAMVGGIVIYVGEFQLNDEQVVRERSGKILGALLLAPLPLTYLVRYLIGLSLANSHRGPGIPEIPGWVSYIGLIVATLFGLAALVVGILGSKSPDER